MKTAHITGTLTAMSPIHHGGDEKTGSEVMFRRMKYLTSDGRFIQVPVISGNAIRGQLRRRVFRDLCTEVGYEPPVKMYHSLFSGGVLEEVSSGSGKVDLEMREAIRSLLPPLSLLGASILNQVVAGKLQVGIATPICRELNLYHPSDLQSETSFYEFLDDSFQTRKDDIKDRAADDPAVQMLVTFETLAPGTRFYHSLTLQDYSEVEASCLRRMIDLWQSDPYVGARSATGYGQVRIEYTWPKDWPDAEVYQQFLSSERSAILDVLRKIESALG